ncbi:hypothetical protein [Domibacillus iocasae]|uniref:Uncharacterized protein n=1 Tax=Domibacillus iocasae TaxID=1714016 RepID=A0A1E7DR55_9BACI|nr:hypothetical protein [Domibacillus iocasae]OES45543.1 hypothetical protein BA724_01640 [Domibacillus iocasae]
MQVEKRALHILAKMKNGIKPEQGSVDLEAFGEALHFLDSNNLATGITVNRSGEGKEIVGYSIEEEYSVTVSGYEFLEKNVGQEE